jgi:hypothetical protein
MMTKADQQYLLARLDETRLRLEQLLPRIPHDKEIYPGWTIKDLLAHISGWDEASIDSLRAHVSGRLPGTPADRGIDEYNVRTVASRTDLDYEHVLKEWILTRQVLRSIVEQMSEDKFIQPLIVPWGGKGTVPSLVETFRDHEDEHARDISAWLQHPDKPLEKEGS